MAIDKIITEKTLNYIETLYLYCNLDEFISGNYNNETIKGLYPNLTIDDDEPLEYDGISAYRYMMGYFYDNTLHSADFLGTSHGRDWYQLPNYRIGIMGYDEAKIANQFNIEIQYTQAHLYSLESSLKGLDLPIEGTLDQYHIKRVDITQVVKTPNDYLTNHNYISPYRSMDRFSKDGITETVYLGHRKNGNVFRMYNKTIELKTDTKDHPIDYKKIELFSKHFGDIEDLYTFELELHRKYLKPTFGIETLADLEKVYKAHREIVGKVRIYEDNDHNKKLVQSNNRSRIESLCFVEYEELPRLDKKRYKPSESYMLDKVVKTFNRYEDSLPEQLKDTEKLSIVEKIISSIFGDKDLSIDIEDSEEYSNYIALNHRIELQRANQDDLLNKEANRAFAPIMLQKSEDLL